VARFHANTMKALAEMAGAAGLTDPSDFLPRHFMMRENNGEMTSGDEIYPYLPTGFLINGTADKSGYLTRWNRAKADSFAPFD